LKTGYAATPGDDVDPKILPPAKMLAPVAALIPTNFRRVITLSSLSVLLSINFSRFRFSTISISDPLREDEVAQPYQTDPDL